VWTVFNGVAASCCKQGNEPNDPYKTISWPTQILSASREKLCCQINLFYSKLWFGSVRRCHHHLGALLTYCLSSRKFAAEVFHISFRRLAAVSSSCVAAACSSGSVPYRLGSARTPSSGSVRALCVPYIASCRSPTASLEKDLLPFYSEDLPAVLRCPDSTNICREAER
jgi:hypothetical protein